MAEKEGGIEKTAPEEEEERGNCEEEKRRENELSAEIPGPVWRGSRRSPAQGETERERGERLARPMPTGGSREMKKTAAGLEGRGWVIRRWSLMSVSHWGVGWRCCLRASVADGCSSQCRTLSGRPAP